MSKCDYCKKNEANGINSIIIPTRNKKKDFCSARCYEQYITKYHVGRKVSEITRNKIAKGNSKPLSEERKKKISISRLALYALSAEVQLQIKNMLYKPYYSFRIIAEELNIDVGRVKVFARNQTDQLIIDANKIRPQGYHTGNEFFKKSVLDWLAENVDKVTRLDVHEKYGFCPYQPWVIKYFNKQFKPTKLKFHAGPTMPEKAVEQFLIDNDIQYEYNKMVSVISRDGYKIWYSVDFVIGNNEIFIEVQGDYWHANPLMYNLDELSGVQRNNINRDRRKKAQIIQNYNSNYFQIWENDIKNNTDKLNNQKKDILCLVQKKKII